MYHQVGLKAASFFPSNLFHLVRRFPPILWTKIRREMQQHFIESEANEVRVLVWAHSQVKLLLVVIGFFLQFFYLSMSVSKLLAPTHEKNVL